MYNIWGLTLQTSEAGLHYFEWLCDIVGVQKDEDVVGEQFDYAPNYWYLLKRLWETEFVWTIPNDDNRITDGLVLRKLYFEIENLATTEASCSVLEMMIGLAKRMDDMLQLPDENSKLMERFFELLDNLELLGFHDDRYSGMEFDVDRKKLYGRDMAKIDQILKVMINRTYTKNGQGGLFPLIETTKDQRQVEIWYQMHEYLIENYM